MPLFHSNAIIAGLAPTVAVAATIALAPRFSASTFLDDVRRYGATYAHYVGTPLSYVLAQPLRPDDADNPLRVVFGNEAAPADIRRFAERFDCKVIDAYGSTEGGISILRTDQTPPTALGVGIGDIAVLQPDGRECAVAAVDESGRLTNPEEAIGEIVNRDGAGAFEGYWDNDDAVAERLEGGYYHSGDLGYRDADGFLYFAGRMDDWLRVGGENFAVAPVQRILSSHPDVIEAVVLGVPDAVAGDQVLGVLVAGVALVADERWVDELAAWMCERSDLPDRWMPRYLRVVDDLPRTGTGKVQRARMRAEAWLPEGTLIRDGDAYRPMTDHDRDDLQRRFEQAGRPHLLPMAKEHAS
jgi:fatty-acyl-CoA synthase